jgi:hypothetical protein
VVVSAQILLAVAALEHVLDLAELLALCTVQVHVLDAGDGQVAGIHRAGGYGLSRLLTGHVGLARHDWPLLVLIAGLTVLTRLVKRTFGWPCGWFTTTRGSARS